MPIILPNGLTSQEIRVLQEFRRLNAETLTADVIKSIKHPVGGGEAPAQSLTAKEWLVVADGGFSLTQKAKDLLAVDVRPMFEEASSAAAPAAENAEAEDV